MKLVDILARELKVWPEGVTALQQGGITGWLRDENFNEIRPRIHVDLADDRGYPDSPAGFGSGPTPEWVYRTQWQAAVDALRAEKVVEWNGEGLPPVGTVCEHRDLVHGEEWTEVEIVAHRTFVGDDYPCAVFVYSQSSSHSSSGEHFRPRRTPEQIAAEVRQEALSEMFQLWNDAACNAADGFAALYDAGYRKFEIVDN